MIHSERLGLNQSDESFSESVRVANKLTHDSLTGLQVSHT